MNFDRAEAYDKKHQVFIVLTAAFEKNGGGNGHDLGLTGALAIVKAWEEIRTYHNVYDLRKL